MKLSEREIEVMECIINSLTTKEIAEKLFITEHTVKSHLHNIYIKNQIFGGNSMVQAALMYFKFKIGIV